MPPKARTATAASIFLLSAALCPSAMTASEPTSNATETAGTAWTIDDIVHTETVDGATLSRDGRVATWIRSTVETVDDKEKRIGTLWLARLGEAGAPEGAVRPIQLTRGHDRMKSLAFSPDGTHLAFLTEREIPEGSTSNRGDEVEGNQVWVIPTGGGEAFPVTRFDRAVRAYGWIDDATIPVLAPEAKSAWELERKRRHDEAQVVEDAEHEVPVRLFRVEAKPGGTVRRITTNDDWIDTLEVSPDGRHAVVTAQQSLSYEFDSKVPPR